MCFQDIPLSLGTDLMNLLWPTEMINLKFVVLKHLFRDGSRLFNEFLAIGMIYWFPNSIDKNN